MGGHSKFVKSTLSTATFGTSASKRRSRSGKQTLLLEHLETRDVPTNLPAGLSETLLTTNSAVNLPTAIEISPTNQMWALEQTGAAKYIRPDGTAQTAITLNVDSSGERGLLGIAFAPNYDGAGPNTDFVYLYYTTPRTSPNSPSHNRISRFTVSGAGTATPTFGSEVVIRNLPPEDEDNNPATDGDSNHNGGAIHFGPDGKLYVAVGDHNYDISPQSNDVAQTLTTPFGKLLRLNADGTNPSDNPFYTGSSTDWAGATWALGLRNPYTFAFQPGTGRIFINDVGESEWEEINEGFAGANYGWAGSTAPLWEGFESPAPPWDNYHDPLMAYDHLATPPTPAGFAITGGAFYPTNGVLGSQYGGKYLFADYATSFIRIFDPANPGSVSTPDTSTAFADNLTTLAPVDLKVDSVGNLYYIGRFQSGEIYRISSGTLSVAQQPAGTSTSLGGFASFSAVAAGPGTFTYQWQKFANGNWTNIGGATSATLPIANAAAQDAALYRVVVSNGTTSVISNPANLNVNVQLTFASNPVGATITYDGQPAVGSISSAIGTTHTIVAAATFISGGNTFSFVSWSDGGARSHTITTQGANATYTATYAQAFVVDGTAGDDQIDVVGGSQISIYLNGSLVSQVAVGTPIQINGLAGNDRIYSAVSAVINGGDGDDSLFGENGSFSMFGGTGDDLIFGGAQSDLIFGNDGADSVDGGDGADSIDGGNGPDLLFGSAGADALFGSAGADAIDGGAGDDGIDGGSEGDYLAGGIGNDYVTGGLGDDSMDAGDGDDTMIGDDGNDVLFGVGGNDFLFGLAGNDSIDGGFGNDSIDLGIGDDLGFGSAGNDLMFGNEGNDSMDGNDGNDSMDGNNGNDLMFGSTGNDQMFGSAGNDSMDGGAGVDIGIGGPGVNSLFNFE